MLKTKDILDEKDPHIRKENKEVEVEHTTIKEDDLIKALIGTDFNIGVIELIDFLFEDATKADDKEDK